MPNIRKRDFTDQSSKISVKIIEECNDVNELLKYKVEIDGSSTSAQMQIDAAKGKMHSDGEYADPDWWAKVNGYKRMLGFLSQKIQLRIREVKEAQKLEASLKIEPIFMDVARQVLPYEQFNEILQRAKNVQAERLSQQ